MKTILTVSILASVACSASAQQYIHRQYVQPQQMYVMPQSRGIQQYQPYYNGQSFQPVPQYLTPQQPYRPPPQINPWQAAEQVYRLQQPLTNPIGSIRWQLRCATGGQCWYVQQ